MATNDSGGAGSWEYSTEGALVAEQLKREQAEKGMTVAPRRERRVRVKFAWYDLWVGAYIDQAKRILYICPLPTLLVEVRLALGQDHCRPHRVDRGRP